MKLKNIIGTLVILFYIISYVTVLSARQNAAVPDNDSDVDKSDSSLEEMIIIEDPLKGFTNGKLIGGTFSEEGYKPGTGWNHILYEIDRPFVNGYVEFEVKGMNHNLIPEGGDQGFLGIYDGRGIEEPIKYINDFKRNYFRWNVHWRQNRSAVKCVISCAKPETIKLNSPKAVFIDERDWSAEPTGDGMEWDPGKWYLFRVEQKNKTFTVSIDGVVKWSVIGIYDYNPAKRRIWLGCAPGYGDKYKSFLQDIIYRNFKVVSYH